MGRILLPDAYQDKRWGTIAGDWVVSRGDSLEIAGDDLTTRRVMTSSCEVYGAQLVCKFPLMTGLCSCYICPEHGTRRQVRV